jgi:hypothetical protein
MTVPQRVLINSLPKSGTHLLAKAVELCGFQEHFGTQHPKNPIPVTPLFLNYREVRDGMLQQPAERQTDANIPIGTLTPVYADHRTMSEWLAAMPNHSYLIAHIVWTPILAPILAKHQMKQIFIIRDPRAVLASLLSFILDTKGMPKPHFLEADFKALSPAQRLELLLEGGEARHAGVTVTPFREIFHGMLAWQQEDHCLFIRFEDLVGVQGGGSTEQQEAAIRRIATHLGKSFDPELATRYEQIYNPNARTFRQGSIDGWKQHLDAASIERIQTYCHPLCTAAGYIV